MLLHKPIASVILVLAVLIFGGVALSRLSIELMPDVTRPTILVSTEYPGAPASEVEYRINEQLEGILGSVRGVEEIRGIARQGQSLVFISFGWGSDMDIAFLNVREKLDQTRYLLPEQAERPQIIYSSASDEPIATLALRLVENQDTPSLESRLELKRWAEQVFTRRLEQKEGIAQAILVGAVVPEVQIKYDPGLLDRYNITLPEIRQIVANANKFSSTGELRDGWYRYALKIESQIESLDDIKNLPIKSLANGRVLLLHELAEVTIGEADPVSFSLLDGQDILTVQVKKEFGANSVAVFETLVATLQQIEQETPDIHIEIIKEGATYIKNSISNLLQTLLVGGVLAFIVLFLFLDDVRSPFTIGISIPVSIFFTFIVMFLFDIQLNIISLSGLTLGIGLLVDNSIVVLENISRYRKQGLDRFKASEKGTKEIALAVTASTFTTISVFLPLLFLGGFEGAFFRDLAATLSISLVSSLLVALVLLPVFVAHVSKAKVSGILSAINRLLDRIIEGYEHSLQVVIHRPLLTFSVALLLLLGAGWLFMVVPKAALPKSEPDRVERLITMPGNTSLRSARSSARELINYFIEHIQVSDILAFGGYTDNISPEAIQNEGLNKFLISVPVKDAQQERQVEDLFKALEKTFASWTFEEVEGSGVGLNLTGSAPIEFNIVGTDRAMSRRVGQAFEKVLNRAFPGSHLTEKYPQRVKVYELRFNTKKMLDFEISENELIAYLESLTRGSWVTDWNRQDEQLSVRLFGTGAEALNPFDIKVNLKNKIIPLPELTEIRVADEAERLERSNQSAILGFTSNLGFTDWWWNSRLINSEVSAFMQQTGYEIRVGGTAPQLIKLLKELGILLLLSVLIIYLILAIQYEHLLYPLIIILAIPFAWIGSVSILAVTGISLNALSFMGILILTGIAVNDSILKVDFMRRYFEESGDLDEAIRQAGIHRFRPVVMTSLTTILGLIPMLIPLGDGYVMRQSLAIALMGGMVSSTVLTLYLIPLVFRFLNKGKSKVNNTTT